MLSYLPSSGPKSPCSSVDVIVRLSWQIKVPEVPTAYTILLLTHFGTF